MARADAMKGGALLDEVLASRFARIALGHVVREYPNKLDHVLAGPQDARTPRDLHPIFYGSYDWHSCVHGYWTLSRLLRGFPDMACAPAIRVLFDSHFTEENVAAECAYLQRPTARGFERPYGWAWLLKLAADLSEHADRRWFDALSPLAKAFAARFAEFLPKATYPIRSGVHSNTAFALTLAADYAAATKDAAFTTLLREKAQDWYAQDCDCPAWEPSGDDFLSSALVEAVCMRRLLSPDDFTLWFERFLPHLAQKRPSTLFHPARVSDRSDGKIAHLDGLNLSRVWCWRTLAGSMATDDPRRAGMEEAAAMHLAAALPHVADDYMGEHWLATFAVLALEAEEGRVGSGT